MSSYVDLTTTRVTLPDPEALVTALRSTIDPTVGVGALDRGLYRLKKATPWLPAHVTSAQTALDTVGALTVQAAAQTWIDRMPLGEQAILLALIDQLNVIRAALPTPLAAITKAQAITAVRNKAGTL